MRENTGLTISQMEYNTHERAFLLAFVRGWWDKNRFCTDQFMRRYCTFFRQ